ncbi:MAG: hypothetical protein ABI687_11635 [Flavitalea sp.]
MKSIVFFAFLAVAAIGCDTPGATSQTDQSAVDTTSAMTSPAMTTDTVVTTPVDTTSMPADTTMKK